MHAAWNAAARRRPDPGQGLAVVLYAASLAAVPLLMITGLPTRVAWPWLGGGLVANIISARTLMAAYRRAPFAVSYPITRGLTPPLVAVAAAVVTAEVPSKHALLGIAAVSLALLVLAGRALRLGETPLSGVLLAAVSSVFAAGYVFTDAQGVRAAGFVWNGPPLNGTGSGYRKRRYSRGTGMLKRSHSAETSAQSVGPSW